MPLGIAFIIGVLLFGLGKAAVNTNQEKHDTNIIQNIVSIK